MSSYNLTYNCYKSFSLSYKRPYSLPLQWPLTTDLVRHFGQEVPEPAQWRDAGLELAVFHQHTQRLDHGQHVQLQGTVETVGSNIRGLGICTREQYIMADILNMFVKYTQTHKYRCTNSFQADLRQFEHLGHFLKKIL